jgi:hypothetical protein
MCSTLRSDHRAKLQNAERQDFVFSARGYEIDAFFMANWVSRIAYISPTGFDMAGVENFLATNGPGATWTGPNKDDADGSYRWDGLKNGASAYTASLSLYGLRKMTNSGVRIMLKRPTVCNYRAGCEFFWLGR